MQTSIELTTTIIPSSSQVIPRVTRRYMNELIIRTLILLTDRNLSYVWRTLPNDADLSYLDLSNLNLRGINFKDSFLIYTNFANSELDDSTFEDAWVRNVDFKGASLSNVKFDNTDWFNALNLPEHEKNGWPEPYTDWMDCPNNYKSVVEGRCRQSPQ
jgi:hypothetical protein